MTMFTQDQINLFWSHVNIRTKDECWPWLLSKDRDGYGKTKIGGSFYISHRTAYQMYHEIDKLNDQHVLHTCDNPSCCNPGHLYLGSRLENMKDMLSRKRQGCSYSNPRKMDLEKAENLRTEYELGFSKRSLARRYGITPKHVRDILNGLYWIAA